ncbi:MAG: xanthine dehydrogenase family protein molybdopterin-binding subunit [Thermoleophilia bacterium]
MGKIAPPLMHSLRGRYFGRPLDRLEDPRLLTGNASFLADLELPGALHAAFHRSFLPHALLTAVDVEDATRVDGVEAVFTAADLEHEPLTDLLPIDGLRRTPQFALATGRVRFVGEPIALVLARSRGEAEDGAELIAPDYDPLPAVSDAESALEPDAPVLHPELGSNVVYRETTTYGEPAAAFLNADHVVSLRLQHNRYSACPLETRGCAARWDPAVGELTFWSSTQSPHLLRRRLSGATGIAEARIRVLVPDVGGGFGQKIPLHPEELAVALAARRTRRPVIWLEDRYENLVGAPQAKEQTIDLELALSADGTFLALRARILGDAGAYSYNNGSALIEPFLCAVLMPGVYTLRHLETEVIAAVTNKAPVAPYRGVGWTAGHCARELLIDEAARELGLDPAELRRRNIIPPGSFPSTSCTGMEYDSGSFRESLDRALEMADYDGFRIEQSRLRGEGRYVGIGISPYVEPTGWGTEGSRQASWVLTSHDAARVTIEPSGEVVIAVGTPSQGQGHATVLAQVAADVLGADPGDVRVLANDTDAVPLSGPGTRASRTAVVIAGAVLAASTELRGRVLTLASLLLEASPDELEIVDGGVAHRDTPNNVLSLRAIAEAAYFRPDLRSRLESPELSVTRFHDPPATYANGCIIAFVTVDPGTGGTRVDRVVAVEDCGTVINPAIVAGQIRGAIAQGIGGALLESMPYDADGQPLATNFADYLLPTAMDVPSIEIDHCCSPSPLTPAGIKGIGEAGMIAAPAAVALAVQDALAPFDARVRTLPLSPQVVAAMIPFPILSKGA